MRESGFYWVKVSGMDTKDIWEIGRWYAHLGNWTVSGYWTDFYDDDLSVINENRLIPPEE